MPERMPRRHAPRPARPMRVVVLGDATRTGEIAVRLVSAGNAEVRLSPSLADVIILWDPEPGAVRETALRAFRTCPSTVLVLASREGLALSREAHRASGLSPESILSTGGLPHASCEGRLLAGRLDVCATQVCVPVIGGDPPMGTVVVRRYAAVAGITAGELGERLPSEWPSQTPARPDGDTALFEAAVTLAHAVIQDRRRILCCGAWVQGAWGLAGGFVIAPVPVGARGAGRPLPMSLTPPERALLQRAVVTP